ncbi:ComEC/Rec2 family competence protein [Kineosporia rhizophila]|uniref:ComEC/Rec2 family competence protein n=1 Tax=Kineosporia TaxID=49184 RepID=UPI001E472807|nr:MULTISPECIES: ComEC/Rec2 family competence protein [Kineosporia]MCE0539145.1 ComEC/Rec2 family competence protein [Kineosporia rhizophila]
MGRLEPGEPGQPEAAVAFPRSAPVVTDPGSWPWRLAEHLRDGLREACAGLPDDARGLLPALVVGDTSNLDPELKEDLQAAGLTHLTAVSGSNVAILGAACFLVVGAIGGRRQVQVVVTVLVIGGFVILARPEPSVVRAAVMGLLGLAGVLMARRGAGVPMLAATGVILLGADPWLARSFGFALSVLATAGLLLLVPVWLHRLQRWRLQALVLAVAVPLAAQVATAPVTVLLDPVVSLVSVPANLLVGAAVAPATVTGVAAAALSVVWPDAAAAVAWVGGLATQWIALVAHRAADVPAGSLPWPDGVPGAALLAALTLLCLSLLMRRAWRTAAMLPPLIAACLVLPRWMPVLVGAAPDDWLVVQCDVGQGSATAIRSGPDRAVLVDAGPDPTLADRCLRRLGVRHLDLVLVTHFHADHAEGLEGAIEGRGSPPVFVSPVPVPGPQAADVKGLMSADRVLPVSTDVSGTAGAAPWQVRWRLIPPSASAVRQGIAAASDPEGEQINNLSVVMLAEVRGVRIAALGDVEPEAQRSLLRTLTSVPGMTEPVDVVVLSHHGSANQEEELYRFLHPRVALIGVGADNDYGHPAPAALAMLRRIGAAAFRTDTQGQIAVTGGPGELRVVTSG